MTSDQGSGSGRVLKVEESGEEKDNAEAQRTLRFAEEEKRNPRVRTGMAVPQGCREEMKSEVVGE